MIGKFFAWGTHNDDTRRSDMKIGTKVQVVQKQDQRTGKLTEGVIMRNLTNSSNHPRGH